MAMFGRPTERDERRAEAWRDWLRAQHPLAIASLVLGALSLTHAGVLLADGIAGMVLGMVAIAQPWRGSREYRTPLAWWGIGLSFISLVIAARYFYHWI